MAFLTDLQSGQQPLAVTYFDEAQGLGALFSVPVRLIKHQTPDEDVVCQAAEKLTINYFTPSRGSCESSGLASVFIISSQYNSAFSAAPSRTANIYAPILCTRLRPERY